MQKQSSIIDDLMTLGGSVLGNLANVRHEVKAQVKQQVDVMARQLDLVSREEFDATFAMLSKVREVQEELRDRLSIIESRLKIVTPKSAKKPPKSSLPIVKTSRQSRKRS